MLTNTKALFLSLLRTYRCNLVLDVGSCDGAQALAFRDVLPTADIVAFEANPFNFEQMAQNRTLQDRCIAVCDLAISNVDGAVPFYITDVDYTASDTMDNNRETSSMLEHPALRVRESIQIKSSRLDTFICDRHPANDAVALWIDVESAEYFVLEGMSGIRDRVKLVHVETARSPMRKGQICMEEIRQLMVGWGFSPIGSNLRPESNWGDVVFVNDEDYRRRLWQSMVALMKARVAYVLRSDEAAARLKTNCPRLYSVCRKLFLTVIR